MQQLTIGWRIKGIVPFVADCFYPPQNKQNKLRGIKDWLRDQARATHLAEPFCLNEYFDWTRGSNMSSERAEESGLFSKNTGHLSRPARDVEHGGVSD